MEYWIISDLTEKIGLAKYKCPKCGFTHVRDENGTVSYSQCPRRGIDLKYEHSHKIDYITLIKLKYIKLLQSEWKRIQSRREKLVFFQAFDEAIICRDIL